jgi:hypothetical protein
MSPGTFSRTDPGADHPGRRAGDVHLGDVVSPSLVVGIDFRPKRRIEMTASSKTVVSLLSAVYLLSVASDAHAGITSWANFFGIGGGTASLTAAATGAVGTAGLTGLGPTTVTAPVPPGAAAGSFATANWGPVWTAGGAAVGAVNAAGGRDGYDATVLSPVSSNAAFSGALTGTVFTISGSWSATAGISLQEVALINLNPASIPSGFLGSVATLESLGIITPADVLYQNDQTGAFNQPTFTATVTISPNISDPETNLTLLEDAAAPAVPEPSTLVMLSTALLVGGGLWWRRRIAT